jgi:prepilin-type N-terminal cleavage/methylation domain-containing protein
MDVKHFKSSAGFTLIEMIIVILIISILSVIVIVQLPTTPVNLAAAAEAFANDIRFTQALSMTKGQRFYLFTPSGTNYEIISRTGTPVMGGFGSVVINFPAGVSFGATTNIPNGTLEFDGRGTPYSDTALPGTPLTAAATIALVNGTQTMTITVNPQTGSVTVQ